MKALHLFKSLPRTHQISIGATVCIGMLLMFFPNESATASKWEDALVLETDVRYKLPLALPESQSLHSDWLEEDNWQREVVGRGDTLARIFKRIGFTAKDTHNVSRAGKATSALVSLRPGDELLYQKTQDGSFKKLQYTLTSTQTLNVQTKDDGQLHSWVDEAPVEVRNNFAQGEIESSFWNAGVSAGLTDNQIMRLAGIFGWDIDFAIEIRKGDTFNVVFEEKYIDGEFVGHGDIVAAEFINQGDQFQAILYSDGNYYTPAGRSMRKSFLRAPVSFQYVSSNFTKARFHPVQKRWKPHRGTDYVAPVGTPVMAAGDGKVIESGYNRFNGHYVFLQHGERYTTKYLHFTKRAVNKGEFVRQGQTIGFLGATGMITGAHVHYEFLVDGVHRNPRTVDLPKALPIDKKERDAFNAIAKVYLEKMKTTKRVMLALNSTDESQVLGD